MIRPWKTESRLWGGKQQTGKENKRRTFREQTRRRLGSGALHRLIAPVRSLVATTTLGPVSRVVGVSLPGAYCIRVYCSFFKLQGVRRTPVATANGAT